MIWATVSSWSCFCWLYRASASLIAKSIINLISVLTICWCPCIESSLVLLEEGVCYDQCNLLAKLYWPLPCFIPYSKTKFACFSGISWLPTVAFQSPIMKRTSFLGVSSTRSSSVQFSSVQSLSRIWLFATPCIAAHQASLSITISQSSLRLTSIESAMPSSHLILGRPLLLLPPISPSIRIFSSESTLLMRWPKYWSFQLQHHSFQRNPRADLLQNGLVGSPCSPRDSQESSPTPQFKSINSLALSFLHSPTLTSIHDHCKNHSLD